MSQANESAAFTKLALRATRSNGLTPVSSKGFAEQAPQPCTRIGSAPLIFSAFHITVAMLS